MVLKQHQLQSGNFNEILLSTDALSSSAVLSYRIHVLYSLLPKNVESTEASILIEPHKFYTSLVDNDSLYMVLSSTESPISPATNLA
jgi:hypothetical protein